MSLGLEQYFKEALLLDGDRLNAILAGRERSHIPAVAIQAALQIKAPMLKAAQAQQAAQQPKKPTVRDQVVSETAPQTQMAGLAALPQADSVMPEHAMAAGGIVAFDGGGEVPRYSGAYDEFGSFVEGSSANSPSQASGYAPAFSDVSSFMSAVNPNELEWQKAARYKRAGVKYDPPPGYNAQGLPIAADTKVAEAKKQTDDAMRRNNFLIDRRDLAKENVPFIAPSTDKTQQTPGDGLTQYKPQTSFPAVDRAAQAVQSAARSASNIKPEDFYQNASWEGMESLRPITADQIRAQRLQGDYDLQAQYPQSLEEAKKQEAERSAGLEGLFQRREGRAAEMEKAAKEEKGQTAGLGLMQFADQLIRKPLKDIDTSAAFQTFKDANKEFRQATKDIAAARDRIDEARELDKMGQHDRARKEFREGVTTLMARRDQTDAMANAADVADKAGLRDIANSRFQNTWKQFDANVAGLKSTLDTELSKAQLVSAENRTAMQSKAEIEKYRMLAPGREAKTNDMIRDSAQAKYQNWLKTEGQLAALKPNVAEAKRLQFLREEYLANGYTPEEIAKRLGAPSGGGAQPVIDFNTGKPMG
jgi:hypothetical protein